MQNANHQKALAAVDKIIIQGVTALIVMNYEACYAGNCLTAHIAFSYQWNAVAEK